MNERYNILHDSKARLYKLLEKVDDETLGEFAALLNNSGYCSLTVCPNCRVDDFTHVEGCEYAFDIGLNVLGEIEARQSGPKQLGAIFAETLVGKRVRFPDLAQQFDAKLIHTITHVQFGGYDTDSEEEIGVTVRFLTEHKPVEMGCTNSIIDCGLRDRVEFVAEAEAEAETNQ